MAEVSGLDGLGFLAGVAPVPTSFAIVEAKVQSAAGIETQFVVVICTPTGAHVSYWSRESLKQLADQATTAATGLHVAAPVDVHALIGRAQHG